MKNPINSSRLVSSGFIPALFLSGCRGNNTSTSQHLDKLPGIAKKYKDIIGDKKKELKVCADDERTFKHDKEEDLSSRNSVFCSISNGFLKQIWKLTLTVPIPDCQIWLPLGNWYLFAKKILVNQENKI